MNLLFKALIIFNSIFFILLIFIQKETPKNRILNQNSAQTPLEKLTWLSFCLEIIISLFELKSKNTFL